MGFIVSKKCKPHYLASNLEFNIKPILGVFMLMPRLNSVLPEETPKADWASKRPKLSNIELVDHTFSALIYRCVLIYNVKVKPENNYFQDVLWSQIITYSPKRKNGDQYRNWVFHSFLSMTYNKELSDFARIAMAVLDYSEEEAKKHYDQNLMRSIAESIVHRVNEENLYVSFRAAKKQFDKGFYAGIENIYLKDFDDTIKQNLTKEKIKSQEQNFLWVPHNKANKEDIYKKYPDIKNEDMSKGVLSLASKPVSLFYHCKPQ